MENAKASRIAQDMSEGIGKQEWGDIGNVFFGWHVGYMYITIFVASANIVPFGIDVLGVGVKMGVFL